MSTVSDHLIKFAKIVIVIIAQTHQENGAWFITRIKVNYLILNSYLL